MGGVLRDPASLWGAREAGPAPFPGAKRLPYHVHNG
jgi:hypothetical protein